jgi:hypothetical protein
MDRLHSSRLCSPRTRFHCCAAAPTLVSGALHISPVHLKTPDLHPFNPRFGA